jgi:hypothetical protein
MDTKELIKLAQLNQDNSIEKILYKEASIVSMAVKGLMGAGKFLGNKGMVGAGESLANTAKNAATNMPNTSRLLRHGTELAGNQALFAGLNAGMGDPNEGGFVSRFAKSFVDPWTLMGSAGFKYALPTVQRGIGAMGANLASAGANGGRVSKFITAPQRAVGRVMALADTDAYAAMKAANTEALGGAKGHFPITKWLSGNLDAGRVNELRKGLGNATMAEYKTGQKGWTSFLDRISDRSEMRNKVLDPKNVNTSSIRDQFSFKDAKGTSQVHKPADLTHGMIANPIAPTAVGMGLASATAGVPVVGALTGFGNSVFNPEYYKEKFQDVSTPGVSALNKAVKYY